MTTETKKIPDLFAPFVQEDKTVDVTDFVPALLQLFDKMLNDAGIKDQEKIHQLAKVRSRIDIELKGF